MDASVQEFWAQVAGRLRDRISTQDWCSWFSGTEVSELGAQRIVITAVNDFAARWITERFGDVLHACVAECAGMPLEVQVVAASPAAAPVAPTAPVISPPAAQTLATFTTPAEVLAAPVSVAAAQAPASSDAMTEAELLAELASDSGDVSHTLGAVDAPPMELPAQLSAAVTGERTTDDSRLAGVQPLDPRYRFENFVIGPGNQMVHAAALAVAESPAQSYNPLFVHGPTGLGKTHLLHAIGHYVQQTRPGARVAYVTTEMFLSRFQAIIQSAKSDSGRSARERFKNYFRDVDVLLMDDVQFLAGRGSWMQEELFHIFNALHASGRQIVLTSDCAPERIPKLEDRLRSRFAWGLIADIESPDKDTRVAILRRKAMVDALDVPDDVFELIAEHVDTNVRELEGALTRVVADASLRSLRVTAELAERVLAQMSPGHGEPVTIDRIQQAVCDHYSLTREELLSESRARAVSLPRQIGMYLSRQLVNAPSTQVALRFNRSDHSTILHAAKRIDALIREDREVHDVVARLSRQLRGSSADVR